MKPEAIDYFASIAQLCRSARDEPIFGEIFEVCRRCANSAQTGYFYGDAYPSIMSLMLHFYPKPKRGKRAVWRSKYENSRPSLSDQSTPNEIFLVSPSNVISSYFRTFTYDSTIAKAGQRRIKGEVYLAPFYGWLAAMERYAVEAERIHQRLLETYGKRPLPYDRTKQRVFETVRDHRVSLMAVLPDEIPTLGNIDLFETPREIDDEIVRLEKKSWRVAPKDEKTQTVANDLPKSKITRIVHVKRDWIDPYNLDAIPFVGREAELKLLDQFICLPDEADFKIWTIIGPSGAGKTRLTYEWLSRSNIQKEWQVSYLGLDAKSSIKSVGRHLISRNLNREIVPLPKVSKSGDDWSNWSPAKPHLFIIDYAYGFEEVILGLTRRCQQMGLISAVRLLVLDHTFPEETEDLKHDLRWSFLSADGERMPDAEAILYNDGQPLDLSVPDQSDPNSQLGDTMNDNLLRGVISATVARELQEGELEAELKRSINNEVLEDAIDYLKSQPNAGYPLFAALVGDAIRRNADFSKWDRRRLAKFYLSGKAKLPWENMTISESDSYLASALVCVATACRGLQTAEFRLWTPPEGADKPGDLTLVMNIAERLISKKISSSISSLEPDYLGETFFLLYLNRLLLYRHDEFKVLCNLLSFGSIKQQESKALLFLEFVTRLMKNLQEDEQKSSTSKQHWDNLSDLLRLENFGLECVFACRRFLFIFL